MIDIWYTTLLQHLAEELLADKPLEIPGGYRQKVNHYFESLLTNKHLLIEHLIVVASLLKPSEWALKNGIHQQLIDEYTKEGWGIESYADQAVARLLLSPAALLQFVKAAHSCERIEFVSNKTKPKSITKKE